MPLHRHVRRLRFLLTLLLRYVAWHDCGHFTNSLLEHLAGLLDAARAARDGAEFEQRLATPGLINATAKGYCAHLQKIVGDLEHRTVTPAEIWPFLRVLHVLSLDLHTETSGVQPVSAL